MNRARVLETLERERLLPAIVFIFSRAGCDQAVRAVVTAGITLTSASEQRQIRSQIQQTLLAIPMADHGVLGLAEWQMALERGIAAHHAGLLPAIKETVERLFSAGLVKLVYATETLALGINMPAKTVVLESLEKWNGSEHVRLNPGEYTQLTGRAGRRGIDVEGNAVVLARGNLQPEEVAQLASRHSYPLRSAFFPGYNMVVNLLHHSSMAAARQVLESSFAQFQADDSVVELAQNLRRVEGQLQNLQGQLECSCGDAPEYFQLREDLSQAQKQLSQASRRGEQDAVLRQFHKLRPGQAIRYRRGRRWYTSAVVVGPDRGWGSSDVKVVGEDGRVFTLAAREVGQGPEVVGHIRMPAGGARRPRDRQAVAKQLRALARKGQPRPSQPKDPAMIRLAEKITELEQRVQQHPVHACPDRDLHAQVGHQWVRARREQGQISRRINSRTSSIAKEFDRVCQVLENLHYLRGGQVTDRGKQLRRVFGERDLLVAQCLCDGILAPLDFAEIAAVASSLVYEPRGDGGQAPLDLPTPAIGEAWTQIQRAYQAIHREENRAHLERTSAPSPDLIGVTYQWAQGSTLSAVLGDSEMTGGDFVRWMRQTIDLLEQLRRLGEEETDGKVTQAIAALRRGVVSWTE